jgi:hypothetical protein
MKNLPVSVTLREVFVYGAGVMLITVGGGSAVLTGGGGVAKLHTRLTTMLKISRIAKMPMMI